MNTKKETKKNSERKLSKGAVIAICCGAAAVILVAAVLLTVFLTNNTKQQANETVLLNDIQEYSTIAQSLYGKDTGMEKRTFGDTSEALKAFVEEFNKNCTGSLSAYRLTYTDGASMARGKDDPWGHDYYVTAKAESDKAETSTYTFYLVCSGENGQFNVNTMLLDADDMASVLLKGNSTAILVPEQLGNNDGTPDFGIDEIINSKEPVDNPEDPKIDTSTLPYRVTIQFDTQGGNGGTASTRIKNGNPMNSLEIEIPTRDGYDFAGYYSEPNGNGICYFDANGLGLGTAAFGSDITMFADWAGDSVTIMLNNDGGIGKGYINTPYGEKLTNVSVPHKEGYTFLGYFTAPDGTGAQYYNSNGRAMVECDFASTITLYAYWGAASYTVEHYVMNVDGTYPATPEYSERKANQKNLEIRLSTLVDHYLEVPEAIALEKTTVDGVVAETAVINNSDVVVRLYYARSKFTLNLTSGDKDLEMEGAGAYYYGETVTIDAITETGSEWEYWINIDTGRIFASDKRFSFRMPAYSMNIEAVTESSSYTVTLDANGGYCSKSYVNVTNKTVLTDVLPAAARDGYTFLGWATTADGKGELAVGQTYGVKGDSTVYAMWEEEEYIITLDQQGGKGGTNQTKAKYGNVMPALSAVPIRGGYSFDGYYTKPNGEGVMYYNATGISNFVVTFTTDVTLYANWIAGQTTIVYRDQFDEEFSGKLAFNHVTTAKFGDFTTLPAPTKVGCEFVGWYLDPACEEAPVYSVTPESSSQAEIIVYAKWETASYTMTFKRQGGSGGDQSITLFYGYEWEDLQSVPEREGYIFDGYYTEKKGAGTKYFDKTGAFCYETRQATESLTLYANWIEIIATITYHDQAGATFTGTLTDEFLPEIRLGGTVVFPTAEKEFYRFVGWYLDPACEETPVGSFTLTDPEITNIDVYAKWEEITYTLIYKDEGGADFSGTHGANYPTTISIGKIDTFEFVPPHKEGYTFNGWYADSACTKRLDSDEKNFLYVNNNDFTANVYAKWTANP